MNEENINKTGTVILQYSTVVRFIQSDDAEVALSEHNAEASDRQDKSG